MKQGLFNRYSNKIGINLVSHEKAAHAVKVILIGLVIIAILSYLVAKFGVIEQYERLGEAQNAYNAVHQQYTSTEEKLSGYDDVLMEYRLYSRNWMEDESGDFVSVERTDVLDMIEQNMMPNGTVKDISIIGNTALIAMSGMSLTEISNMCAQLEKVDFVESAMVSTAQTIAIDSDSSQKIDYDLYIVNGKVQVNADQQANSPDAIINVSPSNNSDALDFDVVIQLRSGGKEE